MLKKRLIGVITVKDGWAVQSMGYRRHLPLGHPEWLAENLDRWGADEILVIAIDRTRLGLGPDLTLMRRLGSLGLSTPLAYGGGLRSAADAVAIVQAGAERVCLDALLRTGERTVREISALVGAQAVIGALPLASKSGILHRLAHEASRSAPLLAEELSLFDARVISEALIIDWYHEGYRGAFDLELVERFPKTAAPLLVFGGVSEPQQIDRLLALERVAAVGIGNFLTYREHAIQALKRGVSGDRIRPAFSTETSR